MRRRGEGVEKSGGQLLTRFPVLEADDASGVAIALDEPGGGRLYADRVGVLSVQPQPGDVGYPVVVAVHGFEATPRATR